MIMSLITAALLDYIDSFPGVLNNVNFGDGAEVTQALDQAPEKRLNSIQMKPLGADAHQTLEAMDTIPSNWAQISLINLETLPAQIHSKAVDKLLRLTANAGLMILLGPAGKAVQLEILEKVQIHFTDFGLVVLPAGAHLAALIKIKKPGRQTETRQGQRHSATSTTEGFPDFGLQSAPQGRRAGYDLRAIPADKMSHWLHRHLQPSTSDSVCNSDGDHKIQTPEDHISGPENMTDQTLREQQDRISSLLEEREYSAAINDELHHRLNQMTASFLAMQDSLQEVITSRAWRATTWPRVAMDTIKRANRVFRLGGSVSQLVPQQPAQAETRDDSPQRRPRPSLPARVKPELTDHPHLPQGLEPYRPVWKGTFLQIDDNSTRTPCPVGHRVLVIDWKVPEPDKDSGSCRMLEVLKTISSLGIAIDFAGDDSITEQRYIDKLCELAIQPITGRDKIVRHLRKFGSNYSVIIISRPEPAAFYAPLVRCYCPGARLVFDTVDLHFIRFYRALELAKADPDEHGRLQSLHSSHYSTEKFLAQTFDTCIVVTHEEKKLLSEFIDSSRIEVVPNIHPISPKADIASFENRQGLLFIGGFDHAPNVDAVTYFCNKIMPLISNRIPNIVLNIIGSNMPESIALLGNKNIRPLGYVEDLADIYDQARVFVAPLRYGAGLKGKVGQSMSHGVPVVGTSIAFEGFGLTDRKQGLISDTPEGLAAAVVELYSNADLWQSISQNGQRLIESRFSNDSVKETLMRITHNTL